MKLTQPDNITMPDFITKNLSAFVTIIVITISGIVSLNKQASEIEYLKQRVVKLEDGQSNVVQILSKIERRLSLIGCKLDPALCLEKE